jgi:hypothetical protein
MQELPLRKVLLIQAIEETDRNGEALPLSERTDATRTVMGNNPPNVENQAETALSSGTEWLLVRRADILLGSLRSRSPGIDHVLHIAGGAISLDRGLLLGAFLLGGALSFADAAKGGINIFAAPLALLVLWNLFVYVLMGFQASRGRIVLTETIRSTWFGRFYARWVRRQLDNVLGHSTRFNAPLAPGLRRFASDWWDLGQPLFYVRARRLLHLSAALVAIGLIVGYGVQAFVLHFAAGWEGSNAIGPETARVLLTILYGPAELLSGVSIGSADDLAKLRWTAPSTPGIGEPGPWVNLITLTAMLYIVVPRLILAAVSAVKLWRLSRRLPLPSGVLSYVRTLLAAARSGLSA